MRRALLLALAACGTEPRLDPDADTAPPEDATIGPDAEVDRWNRVVNRVLVDGDRVFWSHGQEHCHLENPCLDDGPGLTAMFVQTNDAYIRNSGGIGTRFVQGTADQLFFVTGPSPQAMFVMRSGVGETGLSIPRRETVGPAVDATHVYWADLSATPPERYTLKRTRRDGDGSVVETLATLPFGELYKENELVHAGGYIWWAAEAGVRRVPVTGGPSEWVQVNATAMAATDDAVYVAGRNQASDLIEVHRISVDLAVTPLVLDAPTDSWRGVRFMVVAEDRVWWSVENDNLYSVPTNGGPLETVPVGEDAGHAFAVLPDRFLVDLGFHSFRSVPR